jgi:DNA repair protein RadA/Sms
MKTKSVWYCSSCGHKQIRWSGQCPGCNEWNTLLEEVETVSKPIAREFGITKEPSKPVRLGEVNTKPVVRIKSSFNEFNRLLGGGIVPGSLTLIGGDPGIGKSTLSLQVASSLASQGLIVLYVSGEESLEQTSLRAQRLNIQSDHLFLFNEIEVSEIIKQVEVLKPHVLIIDSIQIVYKQELSSAPGSVSQVREAAATFMQLAKAKNIATFLIGHVTKSGEIAGPRVLEHLVDTVLYFEGDKEQNYRLLRAIKNRFGPTDEIAMFQMHKTGLHEIANPSQMFLEERSHSAVGSVVIPTIEGTRPILIEVQSLVTDTYYPAPSRRSTGLDLSRLQLLLAVLEKRAKLSLYKCDVFVSVTGGIRIQEPAADLGVLMAISSSFCNRSFDSKCLVIGEVGLGGEIRGVSRIESRIKEGIQMGFTRCIIPKRNLKGPGLAEFAGKIELKACEWVDEAINELL